MTLGIDTSNVVFNDRNFETALLCLKDKIKETESTAIRDSFHGRRGLILLHHMYGGDHLRYFFGNYTFVFLKWIRGVGILHREAADGGYLDPLAVEQCDVNASAMASLARLVCNEAYLQAPVTVSAAVKKVEPITHHPVLHYREQRRVLRALRQSLRESIRNGILIDDSNYVTVIEFPPQPAVVKNVVTLRRV